MATKLNMTDPNPGIWFKFDEDDPDSGEIAIRPVNTAKLEEIRKRTIKTREKFKHGQRFVIEDADDGLYTEMLWDYAITGWSGLLDEDGKDIECTTENKVHLMRNHVGFANFVGDKMADLRDRYEKTISLEKENLSSGSRGSVTRTSHHAKDAKK